MADTEEGRAAVHEAGHALVAAYRGVAVMSIVLFGDGEGGVQVAPDTSDPDDHWIAWGGLGAEEAVYGNGATHRCGLDIERARDLAEKRAKPEGLRPGTINMQVRGEVISLLSCKREALEIVARKLLEGTAPQEVGELNDLLKDALTRE
jgi:ATP-dependent Zn protease